MSHRQLTATVLLLLTLAALLPAASNAESSPGRLTEAPAEPLGLFARVQEWAEELASGMTRLLAWVNKDGSALTSNG